MSYIFDKSKFLIKGSVETVTDLPLASSYSGYYFLVYTTDGGDASGVYYSNGVIWELVTGAGGSSLFLGWFATEVALTTAYPVALDGNYAIVGATDTVWVWDSDTTAWVDSGDAPAALIVKDSGVVIDAATNELNFTGSVSAVQTAAGKVDINVPVLAQNSAAVTNNFLTAYDNTTGAFAKAQPTVDNISVTTRTVIADATAILTDNIIYVNATIPVIITLATLACVDKKKISIKDISGQASFNNIRIIGEASQLIDGNLEFYINGDYDGLDLLSDGVGWYTV